MPLRERAADDLARWLRQVLPAGAGLRCDSRRVQAGDAFFAYPGAQQDGRDHIPAALARGAAALVVEAGALGEARCGGPQTLVAQEALQALAASSVGAVPVREVTGLKALCGPTASRFHEDPSDALTVIAVTGTNGKTSCTQWIAQGLEHLGMPCGVMGTLGVGRPDAPLHDTGLTTPDALEVQAAMARLRAAAPGGAVAIEASSIGLVQHRLAGTRIAVAVFTNLTRDHLDHHGTMQAYAQAKALLFAWPDLQAAVINLDDPWAKAMLDALPAEVPCIGTSQADATSPSRRALRRLSARDVHQGPEGMTLTLCGDFGEARLQTTLIGEHNVANLLSVAGAWLALGHPLVRCVDALGRLEPVPGRLERIRLTEPADASHRVQPDDARRGLPLIVVDYAHTPDALDNVLKALRPLARARAGQVWCVFGAGGDRDPGKRPQMAAVADALADRVVLTSDNPRSEPPARILEDLLRGLTRSAALCEPDRARAIDWAVQQAQAADLILIAGKGHETYQEVLGERRPFNDAAQAREALARRAQRAGSGSLHA
jgi:murE/murF fusion protein